jgi:hypothetical protein
MASHAEKGDVHLEGGISQQPEKLNLGFHRGGHKVNDGDREGAYILMSRPVIGHDKDIFFPKDIISGQGNGNSYRHSHTMAKNGEKYKAAVLVEPGLIPAEPPVRFILSLSKTMSMGGTVIIRVVSPWPSRWVIMPISAVTAVTLNTLLPIILFFQSPYR